MSELIERIRLNCHCCEDTGCWTWKKYAEDGKRPRASINGKTIQVKKVVWSEHNHKGINRRCAYSACGNPLCVNPEHIKVRTRTEMVRSVKISASTLANVTAANRRKGKLTEEDVRLIRETEATERQLAAMFSVSKTYIGMIRRYESWKPQATPFSGLFPRQVSRK